MTTRLLLRLRLLLMSIPSDDAESAVEIHETTQQEMRGRGSRRNTRDHLLERHSRDLHLHPSPLFTYS